jgi:class 3 adenylate cyclase
MSTSLDQRAKQDRTWLCSVVFIDIVQYSRQSVELQLAWKGRLNRYIAEAIQDVPEVDRVMLDTGDGAALCFLGDPEPAMLCGLRLLGSLRHAERREAGMRARIGIHLGPVRLVRDFNGNLNAVGDGINAGQRVMSFAEENQILVSRSFFEVASCLSERYEHLFTFAGVRRDKHERQHTLYELRPPPGTTEAEAAAAIPPQTPPEGIEAGVLGRIEGCLTQFVGPIAHHLVRDACGTAFTAEEVCQAVLVHIPSANDQRRFLEMCGAQAAAAEAPPEPEPAAAPEDAASGPAWDPGFLDRARKVLAQHMGPVARLLVDRAAGQAVSETELVELLAAEIGPASDRAAFRAALVVRGRTPVPSRRSAS